MTIPGVKTLERVRTVVHPWARNRGPELIRISHERDLTDSERGELKVIQTLCECHMTDTPRDFMKNGENCEICGRPA